MKTRILCLALILTITPFTTANAQQCGNQAVEDVRSFKSDATGFCDDSIYARQFEYREKRIELREMIEARREDYIAPALNAYDRHERQLNALNARRSHANDITSK